MSTPKVVPIGRTQSGIQRTVTRNVRMLMAIRDASRAEIATVIGKSPEGLGHKLKGRSKWTLDEIELLSAFGGKNWPVYRFFEDPDPTGPVTGLPRRDSNTEPSVSWAKRRARRVSWSPNQLRRVS